MHKTTSDRTSPGHAGIQRAGFNRAGFNRAGFNRAGFNRAGFNRAGFDRASRDRRCHDCHGRDRAGRGALGHSFPGPRARLGFTLIEILAVVVILGIASLVIVPNLGTRNDLYVKSGAWMVMADLAYAQSQAITTQQITYVQFNAATGTYALLSAPPTGTLQYLTHPTAGGNYLKTFGAGGTPGLTNVALGSANFDTRTTLAFDEMGTPLYWDSTLNAGAGGTAALSSGVITLTSGTFTLHVGIDAYTGALKVY